MDFYFNHNKIQQEIEKSTTGFMPEACGEFIGLLDELKEQKDQLQVSQNWAAKMRMLDYRQYGPLLLRLGYVGYIDNIASVFTLNATDIQPNVDSEEVREILSYCHRDEQEYFVSLADDCGASATEYTIVVPDVYKVSNLIGKDKIREYHIYNPMPRTIEELFQKVQTDYGAIVFLDKAFDTAKGRESAYRQYGFEKLLFIFHGINELLLPFYNHELQGVSERDIFEQFSERYKVEISPDTEKTMQLYGDEREVSVCGTKHLMCNHIKIPVQQCRIYFKYIDGKIYIGHSGGHLRTATDR